jgi:hypothetical protein
MISTNRCDNGVGAFFYPITNIVGRQNSRFKKSGGRFASSLSSFAADRWLRFLIVLSWRSDGVRFGWSLNRFSAGTWLRFLRALTWRSGRRGEMGEVVPAS